jgi:hypothetical protein
VVAALVAAIPPLQAAVVRQFELHFPDAQPQGTASGEVTLTLTNPRPRGEVSARV